jgi:hypothetical protein
MYKIYKYYTGETVWSMDGVKWFITDEDKGTTKPILKPKISNIAMDITNVEAL